MRRRLPLPLSALTLAARTTGALSRLAGRGGGTTLPGKLLSKADPTAVARLAARLPRGSAIVSATNGKTTTAAMAAEILRPRFRLAHNNSGANLVSGVASTLLSSDGAELGLFEVDEAALSEVASLVRPRVLCLGNLFRDQLDRYGELELLAERWRALVHELPAEATLVVNGDDPQLGDLVRERAGVVFGVDDPRHGGPLRHAADSKYCVRCGTPYRFATAYVGHLGDYACPSCGHARPRLAVGDRRVLMLLIKNPAGANEAIRTLVASEPPRFALVALNDAIADGKDVSWIWDVDFEPLLDGLDRVLVAGDRAAELALRFAYAGFDESEIEIEPDLERALDRGLAQTA